MASSHKQGAKGSPVMVHDGPKVPAGKVRHCSTMVDHDKIKHREEEKDERGRMMVDKKLPTVAVRSYWLRTL